MRMRERPGPGFPRRPGRPPKPPALAPAGSHIQRAASWPAENKANSSTLPPLCPRGLSVKEASAYLGVSARGVWRLVGKGLIHPVRLPGIRRVLFDRQDIELLFSNVYKEPH